MSHTEDNVHRKIYKDENMGIHSEFKFIIEEMEKTGEWNLIRRSFLNLEYEQMEGEYYREIRRLVQEEEIPEAVKVTVFRHADIVDELVRAKEMQQELYEDLTDAKSLQVLSGLMMSVLARMMYLCVKLNVALESTDEEGDEEGHVSQLARAMGIQLTEEQGPSRRAETVQGQAKKKGGKGKATKSRKPEKKRVRHGQLCIIDGCDREVQNIGRHLERFHGMDKEQVEEGLKKVRARKLDEEPNVSPCPICMKLYSKRSMYRHVREVHRSSMRTIRQRGGLQEDERVEHQPRATATATTATATRVTVTTATATTSTTTAATATTATATTATATTVTATTAAKTTATTTTLPRPPHQPRVEHQPRPTATATTATATTATATIRKAIRLTPQPAPEPYKLELQGELQFTWPAIEAREASPALSLDPHLSEEGEEEEPGYEFFAN